MNNHQLVDFYKEQLTSLKDMMSRTTSYMDNLQLELKKANKKIEEKNKELSQSIDYAENIQLNLLPNKENFLAFFDQVFFDVKQRDKIGGDWIYCKQKENHLIFALMDSTGHGIPGSLISMMGYSFLNDIIENGNKKPSKILYLLDIKIRQYFDKENSNRYMQDGMDGIICVFDKKKLILKYSMAGRPLWFKQNKLWHKKRPERLSIGGNFKKKFLESSVQFEKGDEIFIFSDGLCDQFGGPRNKKFLSKRVLENLADPETEKLERRINNLRDNFRNWQKVETQTDDISYLALKV